jgi:hypothetical protein
MYRAKEMIIYKYNVQPNHENVLQLPKNAKILNVQVQRNKLECWVLQDEDEMEYKGVIVAVYGTGIPIPTHGRLNYLNTTQTSDGMLVFHTFVRETFYN